jgi:urease accessory protein
MVAQPSPDPAIPAAGNSSRTPAHSETVLGPIIWLLWQLADSAFPSGSFAHSAGLESACQHGEVSNKAQLRTWLESSLSQLTTAVLPFVNASHEEPARLQEVDLCCDTFTTNHVANRASRLQGRALQSAVARIMGLRATPTPCAHLAPVFGVTTQGLGMSRADASRLFIFQHLRGVLSAAVRLSLIGPMEAQTIQLQLVPLAEKAAQDSATLDLEDLAQTAPLLDLWQGAHDRLSSRLFQT